MSNELNKPIDPAFLALLACPACDDRPPLRLNSDASRLVCDQCHLAYPISPEGIPILLPEEAAPVDSAAAPRED